MYPKTTPQARGLRSTTSAFEEGASRKRGSEPSESDPGLFGSCWPTLGDWGTVLEGVHLMSIRDVWEPNNRTCQGLPKPPR